MNRAKLINDLVMQSDDREMLWKCLRERNETYTRQSQPAQPALFSEDDLLAFFGQINDPGDSQDFSEF